MRIAINENNAAFSPDPLSELARLLREVASRLEAGGLPESWGIKDANGNTCGLVSFAAWPTDDDLKYARAAAGL